MKVKWTPLALAELQKTTRYISKEFGKTAKSKFINEVSSITQMIGREPFAGKIEPSLENRAKTYRSFVVSRLNKIIYFIEGNHIEIADFWALRQNPDNLTNRI